MAFKRFKWFREWGWAFSTALGVALAFSYIYSGSPTAKAAVWPELPPMLKAEPGVTVIDLPTDMLIEIETDHAWCYRIINKGSKITGPLSVLSCVPKCQVTIQTIEE